MSHPVPKELKGEERLFVIPQINVPVYKKSILYNGPATLIAIVMGQISGNQLVFLVMFVILNVIVYPLGSGKISRNKFDNGYMDNDKYIKQRLKWKLQGGGKQYISHKREEE